MPTSTRQGLYIDLPDGEVRWAIRRAALDRRTTARQLIADILTGWLSESGYPGPARASGSAGRKATR
jgi:hypothetical protein